MLDFTVARPFLVSLEILIHCLNISYSEVAKSIKVDFWTAFGRDDRGWVRAVWNVDLVTQLLA